MSMSNIINAARGQIMFTARDGLFTLCISILFVRSRKISNLLLLMNMSMELKALKTEEKKHKSYKHEHLQFALLCDNN